MQQKFILDKIFPTLFSFIEKLIFDFTSFLKRIIAHDKEEMLFEIGGKCPVEKDVDQLAART